MVPVSAVGAAVLSVLVGGALGQLSSTAGLLAAGRQAAVRAAVTISVVASPKQEWLLASAASGERLGNRRRLGIGNCTLALATLAIG